MPSRLRRVNELGDVHFLTFCCHRRLRFFHHECVRHAFVEAMKSVRVKTGVRWLGWVVMPEHVHVMCLPHVPGRDEIIPISDILHDLKQLAGFRGKAALRDVWRERRTLGAGALDGWATGAGPKPFWKPRGYDHNILREDRVLEKLDYMHRNPITRGLVDLAEQWQWSSYRFYEISDESLVGMDWDGCFPM